MIATLTGQNTYMLSRSLNDLINTYKAEYGDIGLERVQCGERTYAQLVDSVQAMPFLVAKSLVILNSPSDNKELSDKIKSFLDLVNDQTDVFFVEPKFDKRSSLYKYLKKMTDYKQFNLLKDLPVDVVVNLASFQPANVSERDYSEDKYVDVNIWNCMHETNENNKKSTNDL